MPSLNLTPDLISRFICLPGTALIKCSPAELMTDSGMLHKPEAAADWERKNQAVRMGEIVKINNTAKGKLGPLPEDPGLDQTVYYLGRQDEVDDEYVVVKIGQIVGVRT